MNENKPEKVQRTESEREWVTNAMFKLSSTNELIFNCESIETIAARVGTLSFARVRDILNDLRHEGKIEVHQVGSVTRFKLSEHVRDGLRKAATARTRP